MRLFFLRHGDAEDRQPGQPDAARRLTPGGIQELELAARGMLSLDLRLDVILTSPLVRARETADIVARTLAGGAQVKIVAALGGGCSLGDLQTLLADQAPRARVLLVGHEPDFSTLVGTLIGGGYVRVPKASLVCLDVQRVEPGGAELRWHLLAEHLVRLKE